MLAVPPPDTMAVILLAPLPATLALLTAKLVMLLTVSPLTRPVSVYAVGVTLVEPLYRPLALMPSAAWVTLRLPLA